MFAAVKPCFSKWRRCLKRFYTVPTVSSCCRKHKTLMLCCRYPYLPWLTGKAKREPLFLGRLPPGQLSGSPLLHSAMILRFLWNHGIFGRALWSGPLVVSEGRKREGPVTRLECKGKPNGESDATHFPSSWTLYLGGLQSLASGFGISHGPDLTRAIPKSVFSLRVRLAEKEPRELRLLSPQSNLFEA